MDVPISNWTIIALFAVVAINTVFIAGLALFLFMINKKVDEALDKATPLLERATATLGRVEETTVQVQARVDHILDVTAELVDQVSERVDTTTAIAEEAVTGPLIGAASVMAGINRGLRVYAEQAAQKGDGRDGGES